MSAMKSEEAPEEGMDQQQQLQQVQENVMQNGGPVKAPDYYTTTKMMQSLNDSMSSW
jgi:hypothetical protein